MWDGASCGNGSTDESPTPVPVPAGCLTPKALFYDRRQRGQNAVPDLIDRLKTALADRYAIERELGAGGMATVSRPSVACTPAPLAGTPS